MTKKEAFVHKKISSLLKNLTPSNAEEYLTSIEIQEDWVCFKDPVYPPNSVSGRENRFNVEGQSCYYAASGVDCARTEVPNWTDRDLYRIKPHTVRAFDLPRFAADNDCNDLFLKSKEQGGYEICQAVAEHFNNELAVTGVLYNSYQSHLQGGSGYCLALFPESGCLVDDTYFMKDS